MVLFQKVFDRRFFTEVRHKDRSLSHGWSAVSQDQKETIDDHQTVLKNFDEFERFSPVRFFFSLSNTSSNTYRGARQNTIHSRLSRTRTVGSIWSLKDIRQLVQPCTAFWPSLLPRGSDAFHCSLTFRSNKLPHGVDETSRFTRLHNLLQFSDIKEVKRLGYKSSSRIELLVGTLGTTGSDRGNHRTTHTRGISTIRKHEAS